MSPLNRFYDWADRLSGHGWWLYPVMSGVLLVWAQAVLWGTGRLPIGTFDQTITAAIAYGPYALWAIGYFRRVGGPVLDEFWPATGWPEGDKPAWHRAFTTVRGGLGLPSVVVGVIAAAGATLLAPESLTGSDPSSRLTWAIALAPSAISGYILSILAFGYTFRQLRLVADIHRQATKIDPFDRGPVYAFSRYTVQIGLSFLVSGYYTLTVNGAYQSGNVVGIFVIALLLTLAAASFVVPLWGIHGRLVAEKEALLAGVEERVKKLADELYRRIDADEFDGTKVINEALAAAGAVRDRIDRLPTWPWPPQVLRGFLSALLLPVVVYLVSRLIGGRIGA